MQIGTTVCATTWPVAGLVLDSVARRDVPAGRRVSARDVRADLLCSGCHAEID